MTHSKPTDMETWALCNNFCEWRKITNDEPVNEEFLCSNIQLHCLPTKNQFIGFQFFKKFQDYGLWQGSVVHYSTDASKADKPYCGRFRDGTEEWYDLNQLRVFSNPRPATRNLSFLRFHRHPSPCCFNSLFHWDSTGWCENST